MECTTHNLSHAFRRRLTLLAVMIMAVVFCWLAQPAQAAEPVASADGRSYEVSDAEALSKALTACADSSGAHTIVLTNDITVDSDTLLEVRGSAVTLLGGGHTLTFAGNETQGAGLLVTAGGILNLGSSDNSDTLNMTVAADKPSYLYYLVAVKNGDGAVNMYPGTTLYGNTDTTAGAVRLEAAAGEHQTFIMYGGTIRDFYRDKEAAEQFMTYPGVVSIVQKEDATSTETAATFVMKDGVITHNTHDKARVDNTSWKPYFVYMGVYLNQSHFIMEGGTISESSNHGVHGEAAVVELRGGVIENNDGSGIELDYGSIVAAKTGDQPIVSRGNKQTGVYLRRVSHVDLQDLLVEKNEYGGLRLYYADNGSIENSIFRDNHQYGGVDTFDCENVTITDCRIEKNSGNDKSYDAYRFYAGGLSLGNGVKNCRVVRSKIIDNEFYGVPSSSPDWEYLQGGGGIMFAGSGGLFLEESMVTGNHSSVCGGGIFSFDPVQADDKTIIANNTADYAGADLACMLGADEFFYLNLTRWDPSSWLGYEPSQEVKDTLPEAAEMNQVYLADGKGKKIDGWYPDGALPAPGFRDSWGERYQPSSTGEALSLENRKNIRKDLFTEMEQLDKNDPNYLENDRKIYDKYLKKLFLVASYRKKPILTEVDKARTSLAEGTVTFSSDTVGTYYYAVVDHGSEAPTIDTSGEGTPCDTTPQTIALLDLADGGEKDVYIVVKDNADNLNEEPFFITVPAYAPDFQVTPQTLDFGSVAQGSALPQAETVTVTNTGSHALTVAMPEDAHYTISPQAGFAEGKATLTPGASASFTVQPKDTASVGSYDATLTVAGEGGLSKIVALHFTVNEKEKTPDGGGIVTPPDKPNKPDKPDKDDDNPIDTGVDQWLDSKDHRVFLVGYPDGGFGPERNMTRAEVAAMFSNLLLDKNVPQTAVFNDVAPDAWYADAVQRLASLNMIKGYEDGSFRPDASITRSEFTAIAMRFSKGTQASDHPFSDVEADAWYHDTIAGASQYGWIGGYKDGTFRPQNTITRAEVTAITNRMLGRVPDEAFIDDHVRDLRRFGDVTAHHWAYYSIVEATNAHDYTKHDGNEEWTTLRQS